STARMVAPIGPMPKKVTPIPWGTQTTFWYVQPVAKITNSTTVAMKSNGSVKYEIRLVFNRCHGENPMSAGAAEPCEFELVEWLSFIRRCALKRTVGRKHRSCQQGKTCFTSVRTKTCASAWSGQPYTSLTAPSQIVTCPFPF